MESTQPSPLSEVHPAAQMGRGVKIWAWTQVRENAVIGDFTSVGQSCYVGPGVVIGNRCKIQNGALLYEPSVVGDAVFIGPGVILTNDRHPRATNLDSTPKGAGDWNPVGVTIAEGASIGARATLVGPISIGAWSMVGAGSVVVRDVRPFSLVVGSPARHVCWVGRGGARLSGRGEGLWSCPQTGENFEEKGDLLLPIRPETAV